MQLRNRILKCLGIGLVWLILYGLVLWRIPFYVHVNSLSLPEESDTLTVKIAITDYASVSHVVAQKVFASDLEEEVVVKYIEEENGIDFEKGDAYRFLTFSETVGDIGWWEGCIIDPSKYMNKIPDDEWGKYYTILYTSVRDETVIEAVFYVAIISEVVVIILCMAVLNACDRKNSKKNDRQNK